MSEVIITDYVDGPDGKDAMSFHGTLEHQPEYTDACTLTADLYHAYFVASDHERKTMPFISENEFNHRFIMMLGIYYRR